MAGFICPRPGRTSAPPRSPAFAGSALSGRRFRNSVSASPATAFTADELKADIDAAYAGFDAPAIAPLGRDRATDQYLLELFHGPTFAFKDIALQILGRLFARALKQRGGRATIVAATSGDTGSAAIAALGGLPNIEVFVLHPKGRVSEVQRRQMTTSAHANVHNIALEGSFDDAQAHRERPVRRDGIRPARSASPPSIRSTSSASRRRAVYYFTAAAAARRSRAIFVVPTGNFGDIFAGEAAMRMGLAVERLVIATNANDIMARALNDGVYAVGRGASHAQPLDGHPGGVAISSARCSKPRAATPTGPRAAMDDFARDRRLALPPTVLDALARPLQRLRQRR